MGEWGGKQVILDSSTRAMAQTHHGAGALHSGAFQRSSSTGGSGVNVQKCGVVMEIPSKTSLSHSEAIDIGAAWIPQVSPDVLFQ